MLDGEHEGNHNSCRKTASAEHCDTCVEAHVIEPEHESFP